jgi:hypothetical protein
MGIHETKRRQTHVFTVRIWTEAVADGSESRGSVRDVASGAFRNFREWSDLTAFLKAQVEDEPARSQEAPR